ncbi:hypothetical protein [Staphylococcus aureus]
MPTTFGGEPKIPDEPKNAFPLLINGKTFFYKL